MVKTKKAQVSLEMIIIVGLLVLGTIVLATTFINFSSGKVNQADTVDKGIDSTLDGFIDGMDDDSSVEQIDPAPNPVPGNDPDPNPNPDPDPNPNPDPNPDPDPDPNPEPTNYILSLNVSGNGTVTSSPSGINCPQNCSKTYAQGTQVILTANASQGSDFTGWSGLSCSGTSNTCAVTMNQAISVNAIFQSSQPTAYSLTLVNNTSMPYISVSGAGDYYPEDPVSISAQFVHEAQNPGDYYWLDSSGEKVSDSANFIFIMPGNNEILSLNND